MTQQQLRNKKAELEQWLIDNPNHTNQIEIQSDLRNVIDQLLEKTKK
ncbi:hypothetical protein NJT12_03455 [Flavobacterium sp. AC]|uniref:Uncharacterized protein n=1 Tax=Flavobacterium azizsancarii TaxID=2961580 RepID=A0ABT4W7Z8_9FLAO|nr:hypothetical protein [Flavobacterium azizsancarii]MDA6068668.1 hypothetical protein [Flavobacterium azizsancarii]